MQPLAITQRKLSHSNAVVGPTANCHSPREPDGVVVVRCRRDGCWWDGPDILPLRRRSKLAWGANAKEHAKPEKGEW